MTNSAGERNWQEILRLVVIVGALAQAAWYYPGFIYADSLYQYNQALSGDLRDWHPPIMALFWRLQIKLLGTGNLFYALHITGYWLALYLVLRHWPARWWTPLTALTLGVAPFTLPLLGVVYKDVSLTVTAMLACALILDARLKDRPVGLARGASIAVLLFYASFVRSNAPFLTAPLILLAFGRWDRLISWQPVAAVALAAALLFGSPLVNNRLIGAKQEGAIRSLQVYDLAGLSHFSGHNLMPGIWTEAESRKIVGACYDVEQWDNYASWGKCKFVWAKIDYAQVSRAWLAEIASRPITYLTHRFAHFNALMRFAGTFDAHQYVAETEPGFDNYNPPQKAPLYRAYVNWLKAYPRMIWYMPYFWFALALGLFVLTMPLANRVTQAANAMAAGSIFYLAGYLPFGVASGFRYALPSLQLTCLAALALLAVNFHAKGLSLKVLSLNGLQLRLLAMPALIIAVGFLV